MPDPSSAQSHGPDRSEFAERGKVSPAPTACELPLWRRIAGVVSAVLLLLAIRRHLSTPAEPSNPGPGQSREPDGTVPATAAETGSRVEQAAPPTPKATAAWKQILMPLALGVVSAVLLLLTFRVYPRPPAPLETAGPAKLTIITSATVTDVLYTVNTNDVEVDVSALSTNRPRASAPEAVIQIDPAIGYSALGWSKTVRFASQPGEFVADTHFSVPTYGGGMAYNGLTASVAIPEVTISPLSAGQELLLEASYNIPSGSSYDWSPSPPSMHLFGLTIWTIRLTTGDTPGRMVAGTNQARENSDNFRTFLAGALVALAGAALLAAFQEALSRFAR